MKTRIGFIIVLSTVMHLFASETITLNDKLSIFGDNMSGSNGRYTLSGNVHVNNLLFFDGDVVVEIHESQTSKITSEARLYVKDDSGSLHYIKNYKKSKTYKAIDNKLVIDGSRFTLNDQVGGFDVFCENLTFDENGNYLDAGYVPDFPGIVKDILTYALSGAGTAGEVDLGIQYNKDGNTEVRCYVENLVYVSPLVLIYDFDLHLDPGEDVFGGGFTLQIPAPGVKSDKNNKNSETVFKELFGEEYSFGNQQDQSVFSALATQGTSSKFLNGIVVDMLFVKGAIESFDLGILTEVPIGATGTKLTRVKGSASGLASDRLKLSATVNLGTALDPLITLEDLGVTIKKGYLSGRGKIKIFKKTVAGGKIYYSKRKKAVKVSGRLNLGGVLKGKVKAGVRKSKFSGSAKLSVKTPDIDVWSFKWLSKKKLGYAKASIHRNTRFRAKLKYHDFKLAIQAKYKSSFPYYKFYIGTNYHNLKRITKNKNNLMQDNTFNVDENVRELILVAGNDVELFDFTATDPDGFVYNSSNTYYEQIDSTKQTVMKIVNPKQGSWTFKTDQTGEISFSALQIDQPPAFMINLPAEKASTSPQLSFSFTDYSDTVHVEFYYDTDNKDFDGTLISEFDLINNAKVDFNWNNADVDNGEYYIYAVVDDGQNAPLMQYAPGSIIVNNWDIPAPENLKVSQTGDSALVRWTLNESPDIQYTQIYVRDYSTGEMIEYSSTSDSTYISNFINGHRYEIWATYQNEELLNSFASEIVSYTHLHPANGNNTPCFTIPPEMVFTFQSGEAGTYTLSAFDADADPLTYDIVDMPQGMTLSGDQLSWAPGDQDQGVYNLKFIVSDGQAIDSVYHEIIVYNQEQAQISIQFSSLNLYKGDNLYLIVNHLHNTLPEINCTWKNPFTGEDIGVTLRKIDEFSYIGQVHLPDFPTTIWGQPVNFGDFPIVATYDPAQGNDARAKTGEVYTTSGIYNVNSQVVDETPPAAINDLNFQMLDNNQVMLSWTATGDDNQTGKAYRYDLRYSYKDISSENDFNSSFQYESVPYPQPAGALDSVIVDLGNLKDAKKHDQIFFSIKASDECQNSSPLGNSTGIAYHLEAANVQYNMDKDYCVTLQWDGPSESQNRKFELQKMNGDVQFEGYNIYRKVDAQEFMLLESGYLSNSYTDSLKEKPDGSYIWAIEPVYDTGPQAREYSDTLSLERFQNISVVCWLENGEEYSNVHVLLTALDTIYNQNFEAYSDSTGLVEFSDVFNSRYEVNLDKAGYITVRDTVITDQKSCEFSYFLTRLTGIDEPTAIPKTMRLYQNYPNPFNSVTTIRYDLINHTHVSVNVYNINGQLVANLVNTEQNAGAYRIKFDSNNLSSGIYFLHFETDNYHRTLKMMFLK